MIERVLLFHDDGTVEEYAMRSSAPPLAPLAPPKRSKKRKPPRKRCPICTVLVDHGPEKMLEHTKEFHSTGGDE